MVSQTNATAEQRRQVLDAIIKRFNRVGWNLLLAIAPTDYGTSDLSAMPNWRDYTLSDPEPLTQHGIAQAYGMIGERLLNEAGQDARRWMALFDLWGNFDPKWRVSASKCLEEAVTYFSGDDRTAFRKRLRDLIQKHEAFSDADWSIDAVSLQPLKAIFESLEPTAATAKHAWLFNRGNHHFLSKMPFPDAEARLLADQRSAAEEIAAGSLPEALIDYARTVELPEAFGHALAASGITDTLKDKLLDLALRVEDSRIEQFAQRMVFVLAETRGVDWLLERFNRAAYEGRPNREILPFAFALPVNKATWDRIAAVGPELDRGYWLRLPVFRIPHAEDFHFVVDKCLSAGRGRAVLEMIGALDAIRVLSVDILRILRAPSTISPAADAGDSIDPAMFTYYVGRVFKRLDDDEAVSEEELAGLEWAYFNALQHSERPARTLHKALSTQPKFFVQLISAVWSSKDDVLSDDPAAFETARAVASHAFRVLEGWMRVPGTDDGGNLHGAALEGWVNEARRLCAEAGRAEVGDSRIGRILSAAPRVR